MKDMIFDEGDGAARRGRAGHVWQQTRMPYAQMTMPTGQS